MAVKQEERSAAFGTVARDSALRSACGRGPPDASSRVIRRRSESGESVKQREIEIGIAIRQKRISRSSTRSRTCASFSSSVGTATMVAQSSGMPSEKSSFGSARGVRQGGHQMIHEIRPRPASPADSSRNTGHHRRQRCRAPRAASPPRSRTSAARCRSDRTPLGCAQNDIADTPSQRMGRYRPPLPVARRPRSTR